MVLERHTERDRERERETQTARQPEKLKVNNRHEDYWQIFEERLRKRQLCCGRGGPPGYQCWWCVFGRSSVVKRHRHLSSLISEAVDTYVPGAEVMVMLVLPPMPMLAASEASGDNKDAPLPDGRLSSFLRSSFLASVALSFLRSFLGLLFF